MLSFQAKLSTIMHDHRKIDTFFMFPNFVQFWSRKINKAHSKMPSDTSKASDKLPVANNHALSSKNSNFSFLQFLTDLIKSTSRIPKYPQKCQQHHIGFPDAPGRISRSCVKYTPVMQIETMSTPNKKCRMKHPIQKTNCTLRWRRNM